MCGIVGYVGNNDAYPILINGLKRLEYRGYDSAGVALVGDGCTLNVYKTKGKVADLEAHASGKPLGGSTGIAHTRWATHGEPNEANAHPHVSQSGNIAIVHNGIIENYATLRSQLSAKGYQFKSSTDTEVLAQLIDYFNTALDLPLLQAVQAALRRVIGAYAIAVVDSRAPRRIIAARKSSPLVVGIGNEGDFYLASDASPIIEYTDRMVYLNDGEIAILPAGGEMEIVNLDNKPVELNVTRVEMNISQLEKGGFPHFMLKEIFEQPDCLNDCMRGRVNAQGQPLALSSLRFHSKRMLNASRYIIVACGTSWHAGLIGKQLLENFAQVPTSIEYASEFRYRNPVINPSDVVIAISQSGETADTLAAVELAREKGAFIYGICNSVGSSIPRNTDTGCYIHVGPEIGVASTKAFTGQVTVLAMLALSLGMARGTLSHDEARQAVSQLTRIPGIIKETLERINPQVEQLAKMLTYARNVIYLGRGYNYPVALEGALKLKEISYIHAEGYPAAEMKHGPIALVDEDMPVVVIATRNAMYDKVRSNVQEIKARRGRVIAITTQGDTAMGDLADECIALPEVPEYLEPLITTIPLQLLAYHVAVCKGKDVDHPRNLAKSVTVE